MSVLVLAALLAAPCAALEVRVDPAEAGPGDVLRVEVLDGGDPARVSLTFRGRPYPLYPLGDGRLRALIGLTAESPPGKEPVSVVCKRRLLRDRRAEAAVTIVGRTFTPQKLTMPAGRAKLTAEPGAKDATARIRAAAAVDSPRQRWAGPLLLPAAGRVSASYGHPRTVNAKPWAWHKGVDIAVPEGTPVTAPNAGIVVLAGSYPLQGGTVVIDHGQGLMSALFHLGEVLVHAGDEVSASSPVARVGGAGFSTGAHLHWGTYLHGAAVDPEALTKRAL